MKKILFVGIVLVATVILCSCGESEEAREQRRRQYMSLTQEELVEKVMSLEDEKNQRERQEMVDNLSEAASAAVGAFFNSEGTSYESGEASYE